jgi:hypothetical protein
MQLDAYWTQFSQQSGAPWSGYPWYTPGQGVRYYKDYQGNPIMFNPNNPMSFDEGIWNEIPYQDMNNALPYASTGWQEAVGVQTTALDFLQPCNPDTEGVTTQSVNPNLPQCLDITGNWFPTSVDFTMGIGPDPVSGKMMIGDFALPGITSGQSNASTASTSSQSAQVTPIAQATTPVVQTVQTPVAANAPQAQQAVQSTDQVLSPVTPPQVQTQAVPVTTTAPPLSASTTYASDIVPAIQSVASQNPGQPINMLPYYQSQVGYTPASTAAATSTASESTTTEVTDWLSENPLLAAGIAAVALFLFTR